jgi:hypothetical protein
MIGTQVHYKSRHIGRISYLASGNSSRMFVYCREHQCYKGISANKNPFQSGALKWLAAGVDRADAQTKHGHEKLFDEYVLKS